MKGIIFISDLHLSLDQPQGRLDDIAETMNRKFRFVLQWAKDNDCIILQAGDFFNKPRSWFLLPWVISILKEYEVPIYCVFGQHDVYMYSEETKSNTSLGVLAKAGLVTILGKDPTMIPITGWAEDNLRGQYQTLTYLPVYGASYGQDIPIPIKTEKPVLSMNILVLHAPIAEEWVGGAFVNAGGFLDLHKEYSGILCGDIHREFFIKDGERFILNTGPMLRRESTLYNMEHKPGFYCYVFNAIMEGIDGLKWVEIPHEPAEKVLTRDHIEREEDKNQMLSDFIEKIGSESGGDSGEPSSISFQEVLQGLIKEGAVSKRVQTIISEAMGA